MNDKTGGGAPRNLIARWDEARAYAEQRIAETERAVERAQAELATERQNLAKAQGRELAGDADWIAREVTDLRRRARQSLGNRWHLWEEAEKREPGPVRSFGADAALADLTRAVRCLRNPLRRKGYWAMAGVVAMRQCDAETDLLHAEVTKRYQAGVRAATSRRDEAVAAAERDWQYELTKFQRVTDVMRRELDRDMPPVDADWSEWLPVSEPTEALRIGRYLLPGYAGEQLEVPALFPFPDKSNVVIRAGRAVPGRADAVLGLIGRMLASVPAGQLRLSVIDALSLGDATRSLDSLNSVDVQLLGKPITQSRDIEDKLKELADRIGRVNRDLLAPHRLHSLVEFNRRAAVRPEPYHVLVVFDFPRGFSTPDSHDGLYRVMLNGPQCGVYTILVTEQDTPDYPHHLAIDERGQVTASPAAFAAAGPWSLELERPPGSSWEDSDVLRTIVQRVADQARDADRVIVKLGRILGQLPVATRPENGGIVGIEQTVHLHKPLTTWWQGDAGEGLAIPLGTYGLDDLVVMRLDQEKRAHVMIAGMSGSGKSTLLHTIITAATVLYAPPELELYLIDMKEGVEFKRYGEQLLPHARVVASHSQREFALEVLRKLTAELARRGRLFKDYPATNLAEYRRHRAETVASGAGTVPPALARVLLILDEFQVLFETEDPIAEDAGQCLEKLARLGRGFGIHLLLASQTPSIPGSRGRNIMGNIGIRVALHCHDEVSRRILADNNPAATELAKRGEAIYNPTLGERASDTKFQVAFVGTDERIVLLDTIRGLAQQRGFHGKPFVYDGDQPGDITSGTFGVLTQAPGEPGARLRVWLGEPLGLSGPVGADFSTRADRSLLVIGDDDANVGTLTAVCVSLAAVGVGRGPKRTAAVSVVDFTAPDQRYSSVHKELTVLLPGLARYSARGAEDHITELAELVRTRTTNDDYTADLVEDCRFLILNGLHRCRGIGTTPSRGLGEALDEVLSQGPDVGVFVVATIDGKALRRVHRTIVNQFGIILVRQLQRQYDRLDALSGLPTDGLREGQALLVDDLDVVGLRPYQTPPAGWLTDFATGLPPIAED